MADGNALRRRLSFEVLVERWRERASEPGLESELAARFLEQWEATPELHGAIEDMTVLERHGALIRTLMRSLLPELSGDQLYSLVTTPLGIAKVFATPGFERAGLMNALLAFHESAQFDVIRPRLAYPHLMTEVYGVNVDPRPPWIVPASDPDTGLPRHYRLDVDTRFARVVPLRPVQPLSKEQIEEMLSRPLDLDLWMKRIPPDAFEIHGFTVLNAIDVTDQKVLVELTSDLICAGAMSSADRILGLQSRLRALLRRPQLELGLIRIERDDVDMIKGAQPVARSLLLHEGSFPYCCHPAASIYGQVMETRQAVQVRDLACCGVSTEYEQHLMGMGIRNLYVAPLLSGDRLIGMLELGSPNPGDVHVPNAIRMQEVLGLFSSAMQRMLDDRETRIQAVIKQQYTAIHPSVEWRFRQAALNYIEASDSGQYKAPEPIVFKDVYPLYGLSDIRGSSSQRAAAIQADLLEQLELARAVLHEANSARPLTVLAELEHRIDGYVEDVSSGLRAGDELRVLDFLRDELESVFKQLTGFSEGTKRALQSYRDALDPDVGFRYHRRREFEQSVSLITEAICAHLDREEAVAQAMFPHYFEKFKTDGVDYDIYIGASLQEDGQFQPLFLRNLRIWQLKLMAGIVREMERLKPELPMALEVAHLVLAQSSPLAIRFHSDEKQFDVDGAYNIRYEIVKKRIDKARVRGTREALTQPGRIAIVYSHAREAAEYREYLDFLRSSGFITGEIEELELEDLPGASGLQALRVTVAMESPAANVARPGRIDWLAKDAALIPSSGPGA
jgi:hypothetical protein